MNRVKSWLLPCMVVTSQLVIVLVILMVMEVSFPMLCSVCFGERCVESRLLLA